MKLAVMQPYLFPYIGYFQLIYASDLFLLYDDVSYIKQGFVNRNLILAPNGVTRFTVSVPGASSNKLISDLEFSRDVTKILRTVEQSYSKATYFTEVFPIIENVLKHDDRSISSVCLKSFELIFKYLGLTRCFEKTSTLQYDRSASAKDRLIALCRKYRADCYINSPGGRSLYSKSDFEVEGIELKFIQPLPVQYSQNNADFVPNLSIIDVLMHCSIDQVVSLLAQHEFD